MFLVLKPIVLKNNNVELEFSIEGVDVKLFFPVVDSREEALKIAGGKENLLIEVEER